jgi:hypothetical protein
MADGWKQGWIAPLLRIWDQEQVQFTSRNDDRRRLENSAMAGCLLETRAKY